MSIFPKKITRDESVIIHVRIKNFDNNIKFLQLRTYIEDPNGKIVKRFNKDFLLNIDSKKEIYKDFYFEFSPNKRSTLGKYLARTDLYYKGEVLHSLTIDDDYFFIEELEIKKVNVKNNNINFYIKNNSNTQVDFELILLKQENKKNITKKISGLEQQKISIPTKKFDEIYIQYGNFYCERILENKRDKIYIKNYKYNWVCKNNKLILNNSKKSIHLNNYLSYIWLSCDGIHTVSEISKECQIKKSNVKKSLRRLKRRGLVFLKK